MKKRQEMYRNFLTQGKVSQLTPKEEKVVQMIADGKDFNEIGVHFDVTRERIRQIADKASRKIGRILESQEAELNKQKMMDEAKAKGLEGLTIDDLLLSVRTYNCLKNLGLTFASQLADFTEADLIRTKHFGRKSLNELKEVLAQVSIRLKNSSAQPVALYGTQQSDLNTVVAGIKKLSEEEAREVSLCLLNLLLPFAVGNQAGTDLVRNLRDRLLGE